MRIFQTSTVYLTCLVLIFLIQEVIAGTCNGHPLRGVFDYESPVPAWDDESADTRKVTMSFNQGIYLDSSRTQKLSWLCPSLEDSESCCDFKQYVTLQSQYKAFNSWANGVIEDFSYIYLGNNDVLTLFDYLVARFPDGEDETIVDFRDLLVSNSDGADIPGLTDLKNIWAAFVAMKWRIRDIITSFNDFDPIFGSNSYYYLDTCLNSVRRYHAGIVCLSCTTDYDNYIVMDSSDASHYILNINKNTSNKLVENCINKTAFYFITLFRQHIQGFIETYCIEDLHVQPADSRLSDVLVSCWRNSDNASPSLSTEEVTHLSFLSSYLEEYLAITYDSAFDKKQYLGALDSTFFEKLAGFDVSYAYSFENEEDNEDKTGMLFSMGSIVNYEEMMRLGLFSFLSSTVYDTVKIAALAWDESYRPAMDTGGNYLDTNSVDAITVQAMPLKKALMEEAQHRVEYTKAVRERLRESINNPPHIKTLADENWFTTNFSSSGYDVYTAGLYTSLVGEEEDYLVLISYEDATSEGYIRDWMRKYYLGWLLDLWDGMAVVTIIAIIILIVGGIGFYFYRRHLKQVRIKWREETTLVTQKSGGHLQHTSAMDMNV